MSHSTTSSDCEGRHEASREEAGVCAPMAAGALAVRYRRVLATNVKKKENDMALTLEPLNKRETLLPKELLKRARRLPRAALAAKVRDAVREAHENIMPGDDFDYTGLSGIYRNRRNGLRYIARNGAWERYRE